MIGPQVGNYSILEKLGEGGMGVVYKGVDVNLERSAAITILGSDLARNPQLVERLKAEAKAQATSAGSGGRRQLQLQVRKGPV